MSKQCAGYIIPPLPAKVVGFLQGPEFLEQRREGLERFLNTVAAHGELASASVFRNFLECSQVELSTLKADAAVAGMATPRASESPASAASFSSVADSNLLSSSPSFAAVVNQTQILQNWWGKAVQRLSENTQLRLLAAKAGKELPRGHSIEDPEFDAHVQYMSSLYAQVKLLKAKVAAAHKQNKLAAGSYCDLIECMSEMAEAEDTRGELPEGYYPAMLSLMDARAKQIDGELEKFSSDVDKFVKWVKAVRSAIAVREDRRFHYQALLAAHAAKENDEKTASNSNNKQEEDSPVEELSDELLAAKDEFEAVHTRVLREIVRFRAEKSVELRKLFLEFAAMQLRNGAELSRVLGESNKALDMPLPAPKFRSSMSSFYDSTDSIGSGDDENNQRTGGLEHAAIHPKAGSPTGPVKVKSRINAVEAALSDVRL